MTPTQKRCTTCKEMKALDKFTTQARGLYGRAARCNECRNKERRKLSFPRVEEGTLVKCSRCGETKDQSMFNRGKQNKNGLQLYCKECHVVMAHNRANTFDGYMSILYNDIRQRGKKKEINVSITKQDLIDLYDKQNGICALTGRKMTYIKHTNEGRHANGISKNISVDRIDSEGDYSLDNIQIVCRNANIVKWDLTTEDCISLCRVITEYQASKKA